MKTNYEVEKMQKAKEEYNKLNPQTKADVLSTLLHLIEKEYITDIEEMHDILVEELR